MTRPINAFILGVLLTSALFSIVIVVLNNSEGVIKAEKQQNIGEIMQSVKEYSSPVQNQDHDNTKHRQGIEQPNSKTQQLNLIQENINQDIQRDSESKGERRDNINEMLDKLSRNDIKRVESIIERLNAKRPEELFELDQIDPIWSLQKQAELEYSFFDKSPLKDQGDLQSIVCKTNFCRVKVRVSKSNQLKPSSFLDWANPLSVSLNSDGSDENYQIVSLIIGASGPKK